MAPLLEEPRSFGRYMDWWIWGIILIVSLGFIGYLLWMIVPPITVWYLRKKALSIGLNKANKLWQNLTDEDK